MIDFVEQQKNKPRVTKSDTREWKSGRVRFAVMSIPGHPENNYIIFEKDFFGRSQQKPQRFNLHVHDWQNLKKLVDEDLIEETKWVESQTPTKAVLAKAVQENPDLLEAILKVPNIANFSPMSLEVIDRLAVRVFEIKREHIDLILKRLGESKNQELVTFASLLKDLKLNQLAMLSNLVYQKLKIIDLLESLTSDVAVKEDKVHELFENHIWLAGKNYEIVQSDKSLSTYLEKNLPNDPETRKRPDLIIKRIPHSKDLILIELKASGVKLKADDIGQVLTYKATIEHNEPSTKFIHCFLYGYEKAPTFTLSKDVEIKTFSELIAGLRDEYAEYQRILEAGKEEDELNTTR